MIAVAREDGRWGCLQVTDLKETGAGSRTSLVVGVLPWVSATRPEVKVLSGLKVIQQGLTNTRIFTEGHAAVIGWFEVTPTDLASNFRDFGVGTVTHVWGWRTALERSQALLP